MPESQTPRVRRRGVLKASAALAAATIVRPSAVASTEANSKLELGILGCGGRGGWIGNLFQSQSATKVVALHDYFQDRVRGVGGKLGVPAGRQHVDFDGYKDLLAGKVDAVAIISPPYFHPTQATAAMAAGKHVYLAKPVAVDAPGCQQIIAAGTSAKKKKLSFWVDFQTRANDLFCGAAKLVHEGVIGKPVLGHVFYHAGRLRRKANGSTPVARLRNWVFDIALSGDIIVEQNVHVLDVANWYLQSNPIEAMGTGGRKARVDVGDCWDHFVVNYRYPGDVHVDFSSAQFIQRFHSDLCTRVYGTKGTVDSHYGGTVSVMWDRGGWPKAKAKNTTRSIYHDGAVANIKKFHAAVTGGTPIHNATESANSTLVGVLGRIAAYGKKLVTWKDMLAQGEKLDAKLKMPSGAPTMKA